MPPVLVREMFQAVQGHSALAKLSPEKPLGFTGVTEFVFDMDTETDIVAENAPKTEGGGIADAINIIPVKFEYGMRASDEFIKGTEEYRIDVLERFIEGASRKFARGLDIGAMHGLNPRTGQASAVIGTNNFDSQVSNTVTYDASTPDANLDSAVALINGKITGLAMDPAFSTAMATLNVNGVPQYPEFRFGAVPESFYGMNVDVNNTVGFGQVDKAIIGDFDAFRWGYAQDVELEVIRFGDPDNTGADLRGHNQVYLRCEAYIGWGILNPGSFALVIDGGSSK
jgi:hypothetical protein